MMITTRKISLSDKQKYVSLVDAFYHTDGVLAPVSQDKIERCFDEILSGSPYADAYFAEIDGAVAGYVQCSKTYSQEAGGVTVWVEEVYVDPAFRQKGVATALLERALSLPAVRYRLEIEPDNVHALHLYQKYGFEFCPYRPMWLQK